MSENIFEGSTNPDAAPAVSSEPTANIPTEVAEFVGEGKKYKSVEDALKAVPHAQSHIQKLEDEAKQLREELAKRRTAEELLEELRAGGVPKEQTQQSQAPSVTAESVEQTVAKLLAQKDAQSKAQANVAKVVSAFESSFGDKAKAEEVYNRVASESGLTVQMLNSLAASSPEAVLKLAGLTGKQQAPVGKVQSTVNTESFSQGNTSELSARVPKGATTKDLVNAWRIAGQKIGKQS